MQGGLQIDTEVFILRVLQAEHEIHVTRSAHITFIRVFIFGESHMNVLRRKLHTKAIEECSLRLIQ